MWSMHETKLVAGIGIQDALLNSSQPPFDSTLHGIHVVYLKPGVLSCISDTGHLASC